MSEVDRLEDVDPEGVEPDERAEDSGATPVGDAVAEESRPRRMLDRYEIVAEIARGGMGTVLLGRRAGAGGFERLMAIKLMHEHLAQDSSFVAMLLDEARTAANISHPNAVGIIDVASSPLGYYLVMDYVEGFTLARVLDHPGLTARQRIRAGLRILVDACKGLHAAHTLRDARGKPLDIVHRDVSPQNVLVGLDGMGRIVDFGIALAASRMTHSRPGMLKGKPSYMAPEQVKSEPCDARADVFALSAMAWEVVVGWQLFSAEIDVATLVQVISAPIPRPRTLTDLVPAELDDVIMKALERNLSDRTVSARQFATELERAAGMHGLIASTHEVQDMIASTFAAEIEDKQRQVRFHLAASTGEEKELQPGQMHLVPQLENTGPAARSRKGSDGGRPPAGSGVRDVDAKALTRRSGPVAQVTVDSGDGEAPDPLAATGEGKVMSLARAAEIAAEEERAAATATDAPVAEPDEPVKASRLAWVVASSVALLAIVGGLAVGFWVPPEPAVETPPVSEPAGPNPTVLEAEVEAEAAAEAEAETETAVEAESEAETEAEAEAETEAETAAETAAGAETAARRRRAAQRRVVEPNTEAVPRGRAPAVENNPYLTP